MDPVEILRGKKLEGQQVGRVTRMDASCTGDGKASLSVTMTGESAAETTEHVNEEIGELAGGIVLFVGSKNDVSVVGGSQWIGRKCAAVTFGGAAPYPTVVMTILAYLAHAVGPETLIQFFTKVMRGWGHCIHSHPVEEDEITTAATKAPLN